MVDSACKVEEMQHWYPICYWQISYHKKKKSQNCQISKLKPKKGQYTYTYCVTKTEKAWGKSEEALVCHLPIPKHFLQTRPDTIKLSCQ